MKARFCSTVCPEAARERIEPYLDRLYGYALSLTHHREQARDLVQTCALKALAAKRPPLDEPAYRAWLFKILRNSHRDEQRRRQNRTLSLEQISSSAGPDGNVVRLQLAVGDDDALIDQLTLQTAMKQLSPEHHEILTLIDMIGFSYREAAELLDIPVGTIMSRLSRARRMLLQRLRPEPEAIAHRVLGGEG